MPFASLELGDEVHCYNLKRYRLYRYWDAVRRWRLSMCKDLVLLTGCTSLNILGDPGIHCGPPEGSRDREDGVVTSWVSGRGGVMEVSQYFLF